MLQCGDFLMFKVCRSLILQKKALIYHCRNASVFSYENTLKKPLVKIAEQPKKQPIVSLNSLKLKSQFFSRNLLILQTIFTYKVCCYFSSQKVLQNHDMFVENFCIGLWTDQISLKDFLKDIFLLILGGVLLLQVKVPFRSSNFTL